MTDAYTYITKPTGTPYTNVNSEGRYQYDESAILYDDPSVFYDGVNQNAYTSIAKPTDGLQIVRGMITGLSIPLTYAQVYTTGAWKKINKPTT